MYYCITLLLTKTQILRLFFLRGTFVLTKLKQRGVACQHIYCVSQYFLGCSLINLATFLYALFPIKVCCGVDYFPNAEYKMSHISQMYRHLYTKI